MFSKKTKYRGMSLPRRKPKRSRKKVLGMCLGAIVLAGTLGAATTKKDVQR